MPEFQECHALHKAGRKMGLEKQQAVPVASAS